MNFLFISKILLVLTNAGAILLSFWVYLANRKAKLNQWFVAMTVFIDLWVNFAFLGSVAKSPSLALLFFRLNYGMVALFVISAFYFCVIYFLKKEILEQAVAQRTAQLQKTFDELKVKNDELEKFYHLTVGRELKMVELKNKIKQLEK